MAHNDFVRPAAKYPNELAPGASDYQRLDVGQVKGINGDGGGSYAPTSPIVMGGFNAFSLTTAASQIQGGVSTASGGRVQLDTGYGSNQPVLAAPLGDTIVLSALDLYPDVVGATSQGFPGATMLPDDQALIRDDGGVFGVQLSLLDSGAPNFTPQLAFIPIPSRYLHQGASLSKLRLHFRVPTKPQTTTVPSLAFAPWVVNPATGAPLQLAPYFANWIASTAYALGSYVVPVQGHLTGYYYKATAVSGSGTSGTNPAIFDGVTTIGQTVTDNAGPNQISWTCVGLAGEIPQLGLDASTYYANGHPQVLEFDFDNSSPALLAQNAIDHGTCAYSLLFGSISPEAAGAPASVNVMLHSIEIVMTNITDLRFE